MKLGAETIEQIKICDYLLAKTTLPFYHFVQEGKRTPQNGRILKRMGMKPGVSDIFIPRSTDEFKGLWIELKVGNNKPTDSQLKFIEHMKKEGYEAVCLYGYNEAIAFIKKHYDIIDEIKA